MARKYIRVLAEKIKSVRARIKAGTATEEETAWYQSLYEPKPPLTPTYDTPTKTNRIYRYRQFKATSISKLMAESKRKKVKKKRTN